MKNKIAIIGGGVAGLTAAYLLNEKYDITVFEKSERIGGNAYTLKTPDGEEVDIAAAAFGRFSYKNVFKLFKELNIKTVAPILMNPFGIFGLSLGFQDLESKKAIFLTPGLKGLLAQYFRILGPDRVKSIVQLMMGLQRAQTLLKKGELHNLSLEEALMKIPRLSGDAKLIFLSCLCLISSMHCDDVLDAPAEFFVRKMKIHNDLLPPKALFSVYFCSNRTKSYVDALSAAYRNRIMLNSKIRTVSRDMRGVTVSLEDGRDMHFERVVFACNADQALHLLEEPTGREKALLGAWKYTEGKVIVHNDHSLFPRQELMEGFTFLYQRKGRYIETSVSGSIWALPGVSKKCGLISTQHPNFPIDKDRIVFEKVFRTPIFDFNSCRTIPDLRSLNGVNNTYYCGSHFGFGLHEDAVTSAIEVANKLGVEFT